VGYRDREIVCEPCDAAVEEEVRILSVLSIHALCRKKKGGEEYLSISA